MATVTNPAGKLLSTALAMVVQCEADLTWVRAGEVMKIAKAKGRLPGKKPKPRQRGHRSR